MYRATLKTHQALVKPAPDALYVVLPSSTSLVSSKLQIIYRIIAFHAGQQSPPVLFRDGFQCLIIFSSAVSLIRELGYDLCTAKIR